MIKRAAALTAVAVVASFATYHALDRTQGSAPVALRMDTAPARVYRHAHFADERPSRDTRSIADWVVDSGDNQGMPFVIVDKVDAKVFVFDPAGRLKGATAALLGVAHGDDSAPGIGEKKLSEITVEERTTPAGRFVAERGRNLKGDDIVWVDYDAAVSMHAVRAVDAGERRLERLASPTPVDNRISYGCINVPQTFFENVVAPTFARTRGIVYVLPETRPVRAVFASYDVPPNPAAAPSSVTLSLRQ